MKRNHAYFGFAVLFVLFTTMQTQARIQPNPNNGQNKGSKGVVFVNQRQLLQIANSLGVKVLTIKVSKHELAKLAASGPKGCGCALEDLDGGGGWGCMKPCLEREGVSAGTLAVCVGSCIAAADTFNPVAVWVCAMCAGIGDVIVFTCAVRCSPGRIAQNVAPKVPLRANLRREQTRGSNSAQVRLNTIRSGSLR